MFYLWQEPVPKGSNKNLAYSSGQRREKTFWNQPTFLDWSKRVPAITVRTTMSVEKLSGTRKVRIHKLSKWRLRVEHKRCLWFHRCVLSDKMLFMKPAVKLTRVITGPGTPVILKYWVSSKEYLVLDLSEKLAHSTYTTQRKRIRWNKQLFQMIRCYT